MEGMAVVYEWHEKGPDGVIEENYRSCGEHCESDQLIKHFHGKIWERSEETEELEIYLN